MVDDAVWTRRKKRRRMKEQEAKGDDTSGTSNTSISRRPATQSGTSNNPNAKL